MEIRTISVKQKRLLFVSLFIVPFLAGMVLIFMGKGIGSLPFLHPTEEMGVEGKMKMQYYSVPNFSVKGFNDTIVNFSDKDSSIYLLTLFDKVNQDNWEEHMMYIPKIVSRYSNFKVLSIYEGNPSDFSWAENPMPFFERFPTWTVSWENTEEFNKIKTYLKLHADSATNVLPYVIIDKEKHIRAYCPINDLKASRDVPKLLKILNNQYAPRKVVISQKRD